MYGVPRDAEKYVVRLMTRGREFRMLSGASTRTNPRLRSRYAQRSAFGPVRPDPHRVTSCGIPRDRVGPSRSGASCVEVHEPDRRRPPFRPGETWRGTAHADPTPLPDPHPAGLGGPGSLVF